MPSKHLKAIITFLMLFCLCGTTEAQTLDSASFDFWVGKWDLTWDDGDGKVGKGTNHIVKTLDQKVIQENFVAMKGQLAGFKGTSLSVFNPNKKEWHQAWADNQGGYFDFIGDFDGDKRIFKTKPFERDGKTLVLRMVFYDISDEALTWDWERSEDGGKTWSLRWQINYVKAE